ncbi:MAG: hypothetical protein P4L35_04805 [Ignavibacteriaceae bacterium]|jgi:hypothetical protein|nr:hypothetical protein [Ignavibacteriaceae bacterium]
MILTNDAVYTTVVFQGADWTDGFANRVMELIKTYPKGEYLYLGITKKWKVSKNTSFEKDLEKLQAEINKNKVSYEQYDIAEFMDQFNL